MKRVFSFLICHFSFVVLLLFVVIALAFTYPLVTRLGTHFAGANIDVWINMWANWWSGKVLRGLISGQSLSFYHTTDILYPRGVPLYFHSFSHTNTALWMLLEPLVGPLAAYNITVLLGFVLLGFGIYLLVRELTGQAGAGVVAGLAATFAPYHVWESAHPTIFSTQYIPLALWALVVTFRRFSDGERTQESPWRRGALVGLFLTLIALSGWHQPIYAAVILGPYLVMRVGDWRLEVGDWRLALLVAALVAALLVGPVVYPLLREQLRAGYAEPDIDWVFDTDVLAWVTPSFLHPLWGEAVRPIYERFPAPNRPAFVGYTVLALALLGLRHWWRERRQHGWLVISTLLALVMALGTRLYVNGELVIPDLPWYRPIIGFIRTPVRLNLMLGQCLAILAGFGVAELLRKSCVLRHASCVMLLSVLILFEFLAWPFPSTHAYVPPFYHQLAQETGDFAIVEAPLDRQTDKFYMYWQILHGKSLVNGHVSRPPESAFDFIEGNALTRAFAHREELRGRDGLGTALDALAGSNINYVLIHKQFLPPELAADWSAALATRPIYEDDYLTAFTTQPRAGVHFDVAHDFGGLLLSQAWLEPGAPPILESHWSADEPRKVMLNLSPMGAGENDARPASSLAYTQALNVEQGTFSTMRTPLALPDLPPGDYTLSLSDEKRQSQGRPPTDLSFAHSSFVICRLSLGAEVEFCSRRRPDAVWDGAIALRGVDWHRIANTVYVDLQWEALRALEVDYKLFVHLLPVEGDTAPLAQFDGMPRSWTYPTSEWREGELVTDQARIDLRGVSADAYRIAIGWYDPDTQQRLPGGLELENSE